jgi:(1->4)-alpha-D-glucan 1-alpha-D-glucosylmutase
MTDLPSARIPCATYRVQFNKDFTFRDARTIISYLHELGFSDMYAAPYFEAKQGSLHGYDIVDHNRFNPEVGTEEDYAGLIEELHRNEMGQILDIVPNHMCIESPVNRWWMDVLEHGQSSAFAHFFDIDWTPVKKELLNKVLLPFLGDQYGTVLEKQHLRLTFEEGGFFVSYFDQKFPVLPKSYVVVLGYRLEDLQQRTAEDHPAVVELLSIMTALRHLPAPTQSDTAHARERNRETEVVKRRLKALFQQEPLIRDHLNENLKSINGQHGEPRSFDLLDDLMHDQIYRLAHWRVATEEINYRRFFDINGLAAIRMEHPEVFAETHRFIFRLIRDGSVNGLRVDHPDGLYNPVEYFQWLQRGCFINQKLGKAFLPPDDPVSEDEIVDRERELANEYARAVQENPDYKPFYIVGEKILTKSERMPGDWPIFSTTGYVFLNSANGIFVDSENARSFDRLYTRFIGAKLNFPDIISDKKKLVMQVAMASEVNTLGRYLNDLSEKSRHTRDFTLNSLRSAIVEVVAAFPVYRTYINTCRVNDRDAQYIEHAVARAKRRNPAISESIFDFLKEVLLLRLPEGSTPRDKSDWLDFVMRFQQLTGPVMAKGVEDTALCIYNRLVSLNEVGGMPDRFGTPLETFHGQNIERIKNWPHAMITSSTHDTKRNEHVRARINVLSEIPREWAQQIKNWSQLNRKWKSAIDGEKVPDRNDEYLLYQTLVGVWPVQTPAGADYDAFVRRIKDYMIKEAREAKVNTSWINSHKAYEDGLATFVDAVLRPVPDNQFLLQLIPFQRKVSHHGMFNSLSQTLLKITAPGVPDFYQGTELWDYCLVDPDNRRPVDYAVRKKMLDGLKTTAARTPAADLCRQLTVTKEDGRIMLYLVYKALRFRKANSPLFEHGDYVPLEADGIGSRHICAFERRNQETSAITAVPRLLTHIAPGPELPLGKTVWGDTILMIPGSEAGIHYRNILSGQQLTTELWGGHMIGLPAADVFSCFPVALLSRIS